LDAISPLKSFLKLYFNGKTNNFFWTAGFFLPAINATVFSKFILVEFSLCTTQLVRIFPCPKIALSGDPLLLSYHHGLDLFFFE
jgi:hypothetical protein